MQSLQAVKELQRKPSPAGRPQPLAFFKGVLWMGSWETNKLYAIDPQSWAVKEEVQAPGRPFGLAAFGDAIAVVVALDDDDRYLFRFAPGRGFDNKIACPDFTGSHLASDGRTLYLCQQGRRRILELDSNGSAKREIALTTSCPGFAFDDRGESFMIAGDEEFENLEFGRVDLAQATAALTPSASVPCDGVRALTFDGNNWWTSDREIAQIVAFNR